MKEKVNFCVKKRNKGFKKNSASYIKLKSSLESYIML